MIREEFVSRPGLQLSLREAQALWGLDSSDLEAVLSAFVDARLLHRSSQGIYAAIDDPAGVRTAQSRCNFTAPL